MFCFVFPSFITGHDAMPFRQKPLEGSTCTEFFFGGGGSDFSPGRSHRELHQPVLMFGIRIMDFFLNVLGLRAHSINPVIS